jgi:hypothetical protein
MEKDFRGELNHYYTQMKIHPDTFNCDYQSCCRQYANQEMTEAKMLMVGSLYGKKYPRITVVSLDPPKGKDGVFKLPVNRSTEFVSEFHESEDFRVNRPNVHWAMTQIIVKDILILLGLQSSQNSAVVLESYSGRRIENVSSYFAHVNVAKCSMNNEENEQADFQVHQKCGYAYLLGELELLLPEILVSQGKRANAIMGHLLRMPGVEDDLPTAKMVHIGGGQVLWLPMDHPARHIAEIRQRWPFYVDAITKWVIEKSDDPIYPLSEEFTLVDQPEIELQPSPLATSTESFDKVIATEPLSEQLDYSDFGLYKCLSCGKMGLGFDKKNHEREKHGGKAVEWKKIK